MITRLFDGPVQALSPAARVALALRRHGPHTPLELASTVGLEPEETLSCLRKLADVDIVTGSGPADRASDSVFRFHGRAGVVAGVHVNNREVRAALCDLGGTVLHFRESSLPPFSSLDEDLAHLVDDLHTDLRTAGIAASQLWDVTFAASAAVDIRGRLLATPTGGSWSGTNPAGWVSEQLGAPVVAFSEATLAAVAEAAIGAGRAARDFVNITIDRRLSVQPVINARPYSGADQLAGSVGHSFGDRIDTDGVFLWGDCTAAELLNRARHGDQDANHILGEVFEGLAAGIADCIFHFNPELVILDGSTSPLLHPWLPQLRQQVLANVGTNGARVNIAISRLDGEAAVAGATIMALEHAMSSLLGEPVPATPPNRWTHGNLGTANRNANHLIPALQD